MRRILATLAAVLGLGMVTTACFPLDIPSLGQRHTVIDGGDNYSERQACLDRGNVCTQDYRGSGSRHVGAHRSTHGSTGYYWPSLDPGDVVHYEGNRYVLYVKRIVPQSCGSCALTGDFVLQTSATLEGGGIWLLHFGRG